MLGLIGEVFAVFGGFAALVVLGANIGPDKYKMREAMHPLLSAVAIFTFCTGALYAIAQLLS